MLRSLSISSSGASPACGPPRTGSTTECFSYDCWAYPAPDFTKHGAGSVAILVNSRVCFGFALLGSALGGLTALVLGGDGVTIYHGLYGFNAVLTGIALGGLFLVLNVWSMMYALIGVMFSAIVFAAIAVALSPLGMPALTAPFVLTTWVFLLPTTSFRALQRVSIAQCASTNTLVRLASES